MSSTRIIDARYIHPNGKIMTEFNSCDENKSASSKTERQNQSMQRKMKSKFTTTDCSAAKRAHIQADDDRASKLSSLKSNLKSNGI